MKFRVRSGMPADWPVYREIRLRMLQETPDAYASSYAVEAASSESRWRQRLDNPMLFLALDQRDEVVGTATGVPGPGGTVEVVAMYVASEVRGQGCAAQLLDAVAAAARERGAQQLTLLVTADNRVANRCYTQYGFRPTGRAWPMERNPELTEVELALALD
jgi:ribosomal protein S18 acetylase RimI-like enzyme